MQSGREQIDSLTGLRGVAACWVVLMHFREITPTRVWQFPILDQIIANGAYGVDIFFVLSGFIMCHVYSRSFSADLRGEQVYRFMAYRLARIYPVHVATFILMLALFVARSATTGESGLPYRYDPVTLLTTFTLTNAWVPGLQTPNMPAWSVSAEWFAYALFPALCLFLSSHKWAPALYVVAGLGLAFFKPFGNDCLTHVLSGFLVGMATHRIMPRALWIAKGRFAGLGISTAIACWAQVADPSVEFGLLLFAALILALTNPRDLLSRFLSVTATVYLGEISYSIYMVHWPVRAIIRNCLQMLRLLDSLPSPFFVIISLLATLIVAMASYRYVELPGRALLRRAAAVMEKARGVSAAVPLE
jgi:peptidoglycan/LPS O-acetylase OafA/YrhL